MLPKAAVLLLAATTSQKGDTSITESSDTNSILIIRG